MQLLISGSCLNTHIHAVYAQGVPNDGGNELCP